MQKVDIVIGALGAVAVLATVLGVVFYEELAGDTDLVFPERPVALEGQTATVGSGGTEFAFDLPENATAAELEVEVGFSGQAIQGGSATVEIVVRGPDGSSETFTESMSIGAGTQSATASFPASYRWAQAPEETVGDPDTYEDVRTWATPLVVEVTVTQPPETLPLAQYSFTAGVTGQVLAYEVQEKRPDVQVN